MYTNLINIAKESSHVYITGHVNPDGDCVGAALALAMILKKENIKTQVLLMDIPDTYDFLPVKDFVTTQVPGEIDLLIALDSGDISRLGRFEECLNKAKVVFNIDHHISNTQFGDYNYVEGESSSTSEMVYYMVKDKGLIDQEIAQAIYTGIVYDTGMFKHSCTSKDTHLAAGDLITYGFDFTEIINRLFYYKSFTGLKTYSLAMDSIQLYEEETIAVAHLSLADMESIHSSKQDTEGIVQALNEIIGVNCAVFAYEIEPNKFKVSLRSNGKIDVCQVAKVFSGGGHIKASGCTIEGDYEEVINKILLQIKEQ